MARSTVASMNAIHRRLLPTAVLLVAAAVPARAHGEPPAWGSVDETRQFDDGRIVLAARDARIEGSRSPLREHPNDSRIGCRMDAGDTVSWTQELTRWGTYDVRLIYYAADAPDGAEIEVSLGDTRLASPLASTGGWDRYATLSLGRVVIPKAGELVVTMRCTRPDEPVVMNLEALTLEPACEGTPPVQGDDGVVVLHGGDATIRGTMLRWEPAETKRTLGFWTRATDAAEWTFTVRAPGEFDVEVLQGCGSGQGGSTMAVALDAERMERQQALSFVVEDTGGFQEFRPRTIGRVRIADAGEHTLRVQPTTIAKSAACDIRRIRLVPVAE